MCVVVVGDADADVVVVGDADAVVVVVGIAVVFVVFVNPELLACLVIVVSVVIVFS